MLALALLTTHRPKLALAAGVALGLAEATRPLALPILIVAAAWITFTQARSLIPLIAGLALGVAPFIARDLLTLGHVQLFTVGGSEALHDLQQTNANLLE